MVDGQITFDSLPILEPGWYAVLETFTPGSLADQIFEAPSPLYVYIGPNGKLTGGIGVDFDYGSLYTIVNGWGNRADWGYPDGIGYDGLNNSGDIFYIGVTNTVTGDEYPSYCAHAGSKNFAGDAGNGCVGYMCATHCREIEAIDFDDFLRAYQELVWSISFPMRWKFSQKMKCAIRPFLPFCSIETSSTL